MTMTGAEWRAREEHEAAIESAYAKGLLTMWKTDPSDETQKRLRGFTNFGRSKRQAWIRWVEQRAQLGSPEWCVELVGMTVAAKLGVA